MRNQRFVVFLICLMSSTLADVTLTADANSGHDSPWVRRYANGVNSWGINGTGSPMNGNMWWNDFSGQTGTYRIELGAVLEPDGNSRYSLSVDNTEVASGRYPFSTGSLNCDASTMENRDLDLGQHLVTRGNQIKLWGESVYPCGSSHGQYCRFYRIKLTFVSGIDDATPPSVPQNLHTTDKTNVSISIAWDPSADAESGINGYKVYVNASENQTASSASATITGLTRNTSYDFAVSAVNGKLLESDKSSTVAITTENESAPGNTIFLKAIGGTLSNGMTQKNSVSGALATDAMYATSGTVESASSGDSKAVYTITLESGTWYAWGRFSFPDGLSNSYWIGVDNGTAERFGNGEDTFDAWHWEGSSSTPTSLGSLSAGEHTITVYGCEPNQNNLLDVLCLTQSDTYVPDDSRVDFTALGQDTITLISPIGGEAFDTDDSLTVQWTTDARFVTEVVVSLSTNNGRTWEEITGSNSIGTGDPMWGNLKWHIPSDKASTECIVKVADYNHPTVAVVSPDVFTIESGSGTGRRNPAGYLQISGMTRFVRSLPDGSILLVIATPEQPVGVRIFDSRGALVWSAEVTGQKSIRAPSPGQGMFMIDIEASGLHTTQRVLNLR